MKYGRVGLISASLKCL